MGLSRLEIIYGKLEGTQGKFARDPTGYLALEAGIFRRKGLEVSWQHVQGTEERYRRLESGSAHVSFVVGRAALKHFLDSKTTRILGSSMNSCPYYLVVNPAVKEMGDLKGRSLACRESTARISPLAQFFQKRWQLRLGEDVALKLPEGDQDAFDLLKSGEVQAALLPRPYGFIAEESGFKRMGGWPDVVDDPLPVMIETTAELLREKAQDFSAFLEAHSEGILYLKAHRAETVRMLGGHFGHSPSLAGKTYDDYLVCLDDRLTVDSRQLEKLLTQVAPDTPGGARQLASEWIIPRALRGSEQQRRE
ncbi:MAG: ABC transporter substrate-binding protein [Candidatus Binatia bacterium]